MELIEDIACTQLVPGQRYFSQLESIEFKFCFAIEKLKNVSVTSQMTFVALMYSSFKFKIMLFYCKVVLLFCCYLG